MIKYETDSRKVKEGQIFVAIKGNTVDGHDYITKAIENGASKIITEKEIDISIPYELVKDSQKYLNDKLKEDYAEKFNELYIIGVTGTNGKTTTCYLVYELLKKLKINASYIGTIGFYNENHEEELNNTTPDILTLYNLLFKALELNSTHIVMEVSSHALALERIYGLKLSNGAFTNLTQDHLDYHLTMENYLNDKLKIIDVLKSDSSFIYNSDDEYGVHFKSKYPKALGIGSNSDFKIINYNLNLSYTELKFSYLNNEYTVNIPLTGKFNVYNYLTALALLTTSGFDINKILEQTKNLSSPKGRCETIEINNGIAVIDYAHTPDAVEKVITAYNEIKQGKIITIIGCGGDRDNKKRPIMGSIATKLSDYVIFTDDNPRTENPENIMKDIIFGLETNNYKIIHNRKEAIKEGVNMINANDILLILGKGHENYQIIGHEKTHLDDKEEVLKYKN